MNAYLSDRQLQQHVIDLVRKSKQEYAVTDRCSGQNACQKFGLDLQCGDLSEAQAGLYHEDLGLVVINRSITWQPRIEFTIFHEITHFLLIDDGELYSYLHDVYGNDHQLFERTLERCCEIGAAEFLMPCDTVLAAISRRGLSVALIEEIANKNGSSMLAAAIQVAACAPIECYVVVCAYGQIPNSWPPRQGLYIEYVSWPWRNRYPLARFIQIPSDHLFFDSWTSGSFAEGRTFVPSKNARKKWVCEGQAKQFGSRVFGLLLLEEQIRHHENQLSFSI